MVVANTIYTSYPDMTHPWAYNSSHPDLPLRAFPFPEKCIFCPKCYLSDKMQVFREKIRPHHSTCFNHLSAWCNGILWTTPVSHHSGYHHGGWLRTLLPYVIYNLNLSTKDVGCRAIPVCSFQSLDDAARRETFLWRIKILKDFPQGH